MVFIIKDHNKTNIRHKYSGNIFLMNIDLIQLPQLAKRAGESTKKLFKKIRKNPPKNLDTLMQERYIYLVIRPGFFNIPCHFVTNK